MGPNGVDAPAAAPPGTIVAASRAAITVAALVNPATAVNVGRFAGALRVARCGDDTDAGDEAPSALEHPVHPSIGRSAARYFAGAAATSAAILAFVVIVHGGMVARFQRRRRQSSTASPDTEEAAVKNPAPAAPPSSFGVRLSAISAALAVAYFGPNVAGAAATALSRGDAEGCLAGTAALITVAIAAAVQGVTVLAPSVFDALTMVEVEHHPQRGRTRLVIRNRHAFDENKQGAAAQLPASTIPARLRTFLAGSYLEAAEPFVDAAKDPRRVANRMYFSEEVASASVVAFVAGLQPATDAGCQAAAGVMLVAAVAHLAYVAVVRPYRRFLDAAFAALWAATQLALAVLTGIALVDRQPSQGSLSGISSDWIGDAIDGIAWLLMVAFFVQPAVTALWLFSLWCARWRQERGRTAANSTDCEIAGEDSTGTHLLLVVPGSATNVALNASAESAQRTPPVPRNDSSQPESARSNPLARQ